MSAPAPHDAATRCLRVPGDAGALVAFSSRDARLPGEGNVSLRVGDGRPQEARAALLATVGLAPSDAVYMEQTHGAAVAEVGLTDRGRGASDHLGAVGGVDALVTRDLDVGLVVMVADCVPVLIVEPGESIAAVHAGRRGVALDVVGAAVDRMSPADPSAVRALVGPAIGGCCYEVPDELAEEVLAVAPSAAATTSWGTRSLDLAGAVTSRLRQLGVGTITRVGACTRCGPGTWFSHRGDPGTGRQAAVVCRRSDPLPLPGAEAEQLGADVAHGSVDWGP